MRLRSALFAAGAWCALAAGPAAGQPPLDAAPHVRCISPRVNDAFDALRRHSPTFEALVAALDRSDVIVHVVDEMTPCGSGANACLTVVGASGGYRYLRIMIRKRESEADIRQHLAHELQHAVEIARAPQVRDAASLRAFCRASGFGWRSADHCETHEAAAVAFRVEREFSLLR